MRALRDLAPVPNDPSRRDPAAFVTWMEKKIELQRAFAQLLNDHAEESERVLAELRAG